MTKTKIPTKMLVLSALFTALIAVGAFIKVPVPMWPFTLQALFAILAVLLLGRKYGTISCATYIVLGLIGLPIFTKGGGPAYIFEPTFGCILGFVLGAFIAGTILKHTSKHGFGIYVLAGFADMAVVYALGMAWFYMVKAFYLHDPIGIWPLFLTCFVPTIGVDIVKVLVAALIAVRVVPIVKNQITKE